MKCKFTSNCILLKVVKSLLQKTGDFIRSSINMSSSNGISTMSE